MRGRGVWFVGVALVLLAIVFWWRGHHTRSSAPQLAPVRSAAAETRPAARRAASLAGRITRASDGAGIAGAIVAIGTHAADSGFARPPLVATTSADGTWTAAVGAPGAYDVSASAIGYLPARASGIAIASGEQRTGIDLALAAGGTLVHGTVNDFSGGPIAGALIVIHARAASERLVATTDRNGAYQLSLPPGRYDVTAWHDDYLEKTQHVVVTTQPLTVDFRLVPGGAIHGRVVTSEAKRPVPGAIVRAVILRDWGPALAAPVAIAGDDGAFVIAHCPSGLVEVSARGGNAASRAPSEVRLGVGEQINGVELLVERGPAITGRVVDQTTRAPLAGVVVSARSPAGEYADAAQPTGSDGAFAIGGLAPARYSVGGQTADGVFTQRTTVDIAETDVTGVELELDAGAALDGRVEPPGEAVVSIELAEPIGYANQSRAIDVFARATTADATTGTWTLPHAPPGPWKLVARTPDGTTGELAITVTRAAQHGLVIALAPRGAIAGRVVDGDGTPVPGIQVTAIPPANPQDHSVVVVGDRSSTKSGDDGAFEITGLAAGAYHVAAGDHEQFVDGGMTFLGGASTTRGTPVELAPGARMTGIVLTVPANTGVIRGTVVDANRLPVADAWVTATSAWGASLEPALTNERGAFELTGLAPGAYDLVADGSKLPTHAAQKGVQTGATVTLQLAPLGTLSGHVIAGGAPAPPFQIVCYGPSGRRTVTGNSPDAAYAIDNLAPGEYTCTAKNATAETIDRIDVPAGALAHDFTLAAYGALTGIVHNTATDTPVENAEVMLQAGSGYQAIQSRGRTDALGHFVVDHVAAGSGAVLIFVAESGRYVERSFTMPPGGQLDLGTLELAPSGATGSNATGATGSNATGATGSNATGATGSNATGSATP